MKKIFLALLILGLTSTWAFAVDNTPAASPMNEPAKTEQTKAVKKKKKHRKAIGAKKTEKQEESKEVIAK